jgi:hypothetical protein
VAGVRASKRRLVLGFVNLMVHAATAMPEGCAGEHGVRAELETDKCPLP